MTKNRKSSKQWRKFPQTLDDNYKRRLKPVTERIRKLYKELIEPELEKLSEFEYIDLDKISFDDASERFIDSKVKQGKNKEYYQRKISVGEITELELKKWSFDDSVEEKIGKKFHEFKVNYYGVSYPLDGDPKTLAWRKLIENQAKTEGKSVSLVHKRRYNRNVDFVLGVDPLKSEPWLNGVLKDWTAQNVSLIKRIPDFAIDSMQDTITNSVLRGDSMTFMRKLVGNVLNDSDRRLKLIARDQTNKLYGALTKFRSQANGWDFYQWSDSNDVRVRDDHRVLDNLSDRGMFFRFSDPPLMVTKGKRAGTRGNAGDDIQDRCIALVSFLPEWRFKKNNDERGSYRLIPIKDLPKNLQLKAS